MTMRKLRKVVMTIYTLAALSFVGSVILASYELAANILKGGLFALVLIGFCISYRYLRCPECGRVISLSFRAPINCPYCSCRLFLDQPLEK